MQLSDALTHQPRLGLLGLESDMSKQIEQYTVKADEATGEWLDEPEYVGMVEESEWHAKQDTDTTHFDTYEAPIKDEADWPTGYTETRAIEVIWVS